MKDVDLYRVIEEELSVISKLKVFEFPTSEPIEPDLVAVMMPFSPTFEAVYELSLIHI